MSSDEDLDFGEAGILVRRRAASPEERGAPAQRPAAAPAAARASEEARALHPDNVCIACERRAAAPRECAWCGCVVYCSEQCAGAHAPQHEPMCAALQRGAAGEEVHARELQRLELAPEQLYAPAFVDADATAAAAANDFRRFASGNRGFGHARHGARGMPLRWKYGAPGYAWRRTLGMRPYWVYRDLGVPFPSEAM